MNKKDEMMEHSGEIIQNTVEELQKQGLPLRTSVYASAMAFMRATNKKKR